MSDGLKDCARCGEDACLISHDGQHMACVRRASKCKFYVPPRHRYGFTSRDGVCRTAVHDTAEAAVAEWNGKQEAK